MKNGWTSVYRVLITVMVTTGLFWIGDIRTDTRQMRRDLANHIQEDYRVISDRLARIEQQLGIPAR